MKKLTLIIAAFALVFGLSQCKKPNQPVLNGGHLTQTITFSTSDNSGQKGLFNDNLLGALNFQWNDNGVNKDVIYVYATTNEYQEDGKTDFSTNSELCGILGNIVVTNPEKTSARFSNDVDVPFGTKALRFVHFGKNVKPETSGEHKGEKSVSFATQDGLIESISDHVIAYCDKKYEGNIYNDCELKVAFAVVKFSFINFGSDEKIILNTTVNTQINVSAGGAITYDEAGVMTLNISNTGEKGTNKNAYYTVMMPKENTNYRFIDGNKEASKDGTIDANVFYTDKVVTGAAIELQTNEITLPGYFSVSSNKQVRFSKGNLVYDNGTWKFHENQYDRCFTTDGEDVSAQYNVNGTFDFFSWGSGSNPYTRPGYFGPESDETPLNNGSPVGSNYSTYDWGHNILPANRWFTLTSEQFNYMLFSRAAGRYARATVCGVEGLIILPDNWATNYGTQPQYLLNNIDVPGGAYSENNIVSADWVRYEAAGAVFLPHAGYLDHNNCKLVLCDTPREGVTLPYTGARYWTATNGRSLMFSNNPTEYLNAQKLSNKTYGFTVRLVTPVNF